MRSLVHRLEYATAQDPSLNYCLWPYKPPAPVEDRWRSVNLLYWSFECAGSEERCYEIVDAIRADIGIFQTVFGIKLVAGKLRWEYYFYDYKRLKRDVSISRVLHAIRDLMQCEVRPNEDLPYFMFSLDMTAETSSALTPLDVIHMYIGNPGSVVSSGIAYAVRKHKTTLENFYFFFDAETQVIEIAKKIVNSAFFDANKFLIENVLRPEFMQCTTICLANKQTHDCIYFSGLNTGQLVLFLIQMNYPDKLVLFIRENIASFEHLLFDVGFDYLIEDGKFLILKSGFYGVF